MIEKRKWKRATFQAWVEAGAEPAGLHEVVGWACDIDGMPFVVHRPFWGNRKELGVPEPPGWTVSEPTTGTVIVSATQAFRGCQTREQAIYEADAEITLQGGVEAVKREIKRWLAAQGRTPDPASGEKA